MILLRRTLNWRVGVLLFSAIFFVIFMISANANAENIKLVIDGSKVKSSPLPVIKNGRTLVPVRLVSEKLGAYVEWNGDNRTITIIKGSSSIKLRVDNCLFDYKKNGEINYSLADVPPQISENRTFVPLRLVSNSLGVSVSWDSKDKTVYIDSNSSANITPFFNMKFSTIQSGQAISGSKDLSIYFKDNVPVKAEEIKFILLNPQTGRGPVIAKGNKIEGTYYWMPDPSYDGFRLLAAAVYDKEEKFIAGKVVPININLDQQVTISGLTDNQIIKKNTSLQADLNFIAEYVKYEITNLDTNIVTITGEKDPYSTFNWTPDFADNGETSIRVMACDCYGQIYYSSPVVIRVDVEKNLILRGAVSGSSIDKPVTLWLSRNFSIKNIEYLMIDPQTGKEIILKHSSDYSSLNWFPGPELAGEWRLIGKAEDNKGNIYTSNPIDIIIPQKSKLILKTVGPNQVLTGEVKLKSISNVTLDSIAYYLIDTKTNEKNVIAEGSPGNADFYWSFNEKHEGLWLIQVVATTSSGEKLRTEPIPVQVYLGEIFDSAPIIEKNKFLDFASELAVNSQKETGMSAALQTAQAILETGWGQYTPVDKYTGQLSNNLFGIKGKGSNGSVISNTWEEYNGNVFRVDAAFRAYISASESWTDHKKLLLTSERYKPFREVMHNGFMGAWALKRAGYATDSKYPLKLIRIIKQYDLYLLDEVKIP